MIPREVALVERLKNAPFALIGINTDTDLDSFREQCKKKHVTWRNSFQGSTAGPLCKAWGVRSFPTIYVLDAKGVVRFAGVRDDALERAVDKLLAETKPAPSPR
jgi:hypothetical protein